jgi:hypothetical protein
MIDVESDEQAIEVREVMGPIKHRLSRTNSLPEQHYLTTQAARLDERRA